MKTSGVILVIFLFLFFTTAISADQQGEAIFKSQGCVSCHKHKGASSSYPSLPELGKAHVGLI